MAKASFILASLAAAAVSCSLCWSSSAAQFPAGRSGVSRSLCSVLIVPVGLRSARQSPEGDEGKLLVHSGARDLGSPGQCQGAGASLTGTHKAVVLP